MAHTAGMDISERPVCDVQRFVNLAQVAEESACGIPIYLQEREREGGREKRSVSPIGRAGGWLGG